MLLFTAGSPLPFLPLCYFSSDSSSDESQQLHCHCRANIWESERLGLLRITGSESRTSSIKSAENWTNTNLLSLHFRGWSICDMEKWRVKSKITSHSRKCLCPVIHEWKNIRHVGKEQKHFAVEFCWAQTDVEVQLGDFFHFLSQSVLLPGSGNSRKMFRHSHS